MLPFPHLWLIYYTLNSALLESKSFNVDVGQFVRFSFYVLCFWVISKESLLNSRSLRFSLMFSSTSSIVLDITFTFIIHLELVLTWWEVWIDVYFFACGYPLHLGRRLVIHMSYFSFCTVWSVSFICFVCLCTKFLSVFALSWLL